MYSLYCVKKCPIGKAAAHNLIAESDSAFDMAADMQCFVDKCQKLCRYTAEKIIYDMQRSESSNEH